MTSNANANTHPNVNADGSRTGTPQRRIVYITLEYCLDDLFSGNGVCARSQVRGMSTLYSSSLIQEVIVARPTTSLDQTLHPSDTPPGVRLHVIPVSTWKTTDRDFDHEAFALGVKRTIESILQDSRQKEQQPEPPIDAILAVDWTGMAGVAMIKDLQLPTFFLNFRVYSRMTDISQHDRIFYHQVESQAVQRALESGGGVVGICASDTEFLQAMASKTIHRNSAIDRVRTVWPMLRNEFADIAHRDKDYCLDSRRHRKYFTCIVRLSKDKGPQRFVQVCKRITQQDPEFWRRTNTIPFLAGAASQPDFANEIVSELRESVPDALVMERFLDPETLSKYLQETRLNLHPALYEAFGMTIVEAAACGAPTLLNNNGAIGAEQLLPMDKGCSFGVDMENMDALTTRVMELLESHSNELAPVANLAYHTAVGWTELAYVRVLWQMVDDLTRSNQAE